MNGYATTNEDRVVVNVEEYIDLIRDKKALEAIEQILFEKAELSWDGKRLRFDDESLCHVLSALSRGRYYGTLCTLQMKKAREEKNKDAENN